MSTGQCQRPPPPPQRTWDPPLTGLGGSSSPQTPGRLENQVASPGQSLADLSKPWRTTLILTPSRKGPPCRERGPGTKPGSRSEEPRGTPDRPRTLLVPTTAPRGATLGRLRPRPQLLEGTAGAGMGAHPARPGFPFPDAAQPRVPTWAESGPRRRMTERWRLRGGGRAARDSPRSGGASPSTETL